MMENKEIIISLEKLEELGDIIQDLLNNAADSGIYQVKINLTDKSIRFTPHCSSKEIKFSD